MQRLGPFEPLVDPRFGLIKTLEMMPLPAEMPRSLHRAHARCSAAQRFSRWHSDEESGGFAWDDPDAAQAAAAGEAVERYCGNLVPAGLRRGSWNELRRAGEPAVDPADLALFSDAQYAQRGFPFVRFSRDLPVLWTPGQSMVDGTRIWVPASLVWVTFFFGAPTAGEPRTHPTPYAGIATGADREHAEVAAILELLERDAMSLAWHRGDPLSQLEVPGWLVDRVSTDPVPIRFYEMPSELGAPVVGALAHDSANDIPALGLACRAEPVAAALKAAAEAFQLLLTCRILADPTSPYMEDVASGAPGIGVKPWRADRAYRSSYYEDWRDAWDLLCHLQIHLDPAMREPLAARLAGGFCKRLEDLPVLGSTRDALVAHLVGHGYHPITVDVTTPDVARTGLSVVRVVVPGLYGNAPAAFPYLGGTRMTTGGTDVPFRLPPPWG
ncbi:MAG: YcaO-like family protein [Thermoanaerobaculia bacterium]|nr:YcaO-like family protein [Thermoanaerobaculia bacterium]